MMYRISKKHHESVSNNGRKNRVWFLENITKEALKYETRKDFCVNSGSTYNAARKLGILDKVCSHMKRKQVYNKKYNLENITKEALKYNTKNEFRRKSNAYYSAMLRLDITDEVCSHMEVINRRWTNIDLFSEALKYDTKSEFRRNSS